MMDKFLAGGKHFDTARIYAEGKSEEMAGEIMVGSQCVAWGSDCVSRRSFCIPSDWCVSVISSVLKKS